MSNQRNDTPWTPEEDAALLAFVPRFRNFFDRTATEVARRMGARFPGRKFTRNAVAGRLARILRQQRKGNITDVTNETSKLPTSRDN